MTFPAYPDYQDSGVEWLGEVPTEWAVLPGRRIFRQTRDPSRETDQQLSASQKHGVIPQSILMQLEDQKVVLALKGTEGFKHVDEDDFVISLRSFQGGIEHSQYAGCVSPAYTVLKASKPIVPQYYFYALKSRAYIGALQSVTDGIRDGKNISYDQFGLVGLPVPSLADQAVIAAFLDRETAKIDALIEEQRRLIALLKEKRQAVISHAVTKGLNPHAPMKDSGIEWLGDVPAHWEVRRLKQMVPSVTVGIVVEPSKHYAEFGIPALRSLNVRPGRIDLDNIVHITDEGHRFHSKSRLNAGDIVAVRTGQPGTAAVVPPALDGCNCIDLIVIRKGQRCVEQFLCWYLQAQAAVRQFAEGSGGAIQLHFNIGTAINLIVPEPPVAEQESIAAVLDSETGKIDAAISTAEAGIRLLMERRAALISAAVTGKIDVRGSAKVLPFPIDRTRARGLIATEIIERLAHQSTFGRVKFQKIAFLAEAHIGISELAGSYTREAAGPLDRALIEEMESGARSIAGIEHEQPGGAGTTVSYRLGGERGAHRHELAQLLGEDRTAKLDKLIGDFAALSTKEAEAVATLYGVWNDALCEGASPTDEEIISGFLNDWHPEKRAKFRASELPEWLGWMRRRGIVPTGSGPKTTTGRLFV